LLPARALPSPRMHWRNRRCVRRRASGRSVYNYSRDYDPAVGRYVESDPIGLAGGSYSTYAYAGGNPVSFGDPSGLLFGNPAAWVEGAIETAEGVSAAAVAAVSAGVVALAFPTPAGVPNEAPPSAPTSNAPCGPGDKDRCNQAIADAVSAYQNLMFKRIPDYTGSPTPDVGHYNAIVQKQSALRDAIRRIKLWCKPPPSELPEWERVANLPISPRH
jgi:RHS repeat-associated protein